MNSSFITSRPDLDNYVLIRIYHKCEGGIEKSIPGNTF